MASIIPLNRGSTRPFVLTFTNPDGTAVNLTGSTVTLEDKSSALSAATITVTSAVTGTCSLSLGWNDAWVNGDALSFRVGVTFSDGLETSDLYIVQVQ